ncbi:hypothetical protein [Haliscomenobacter hydrossis]|uniref:Lipoprotein n=1 Tax=Haliscomenobacter hydrossis (strain ATCC 27775 / DSM 1100 / LMG 10767 / O) TaxID=760192 RepID=F4L1X1_HALH1|nr:hypothetical protein [Haliscomenobacter hydrossis]AEE50604.1 hypothetical protein Halhy_2736 [Haliscomenobacter hydrossis DSM 1100]
MIKLMKNFAGVAFILAMIGLASCDKSSLDVTSEDYFTLGAMDSLHRDGGCGRGSCFEFVYPISIKFADGTTAEVTSNENMRETIRTWKENNPSATERPTLVFPLEVLAKDGTVSSVASEEEFKTLLATCPPKRGKGHGRGHKPGDRGQNCFTLAFPVNVQLPDSTVVAAADRDALHTILHTWKKNNPTSRVRPTLVFPIKVTLTDGTEKTVASKEELTALKDSCGN